MLLDVGQHLSGGETAEVGPGKLRQRPSRGEGHTVRANIGREAGQEGMNELDRRPELLLGRQTGHHPVHQLGGSDVASGRRQSREELGPLVIREVVHLNEPCLQHLVRVLGGRGEEMRVAVDRLLRRGLEGRRRGGRRHGRR